jgi:hypothetical protein
LGDSHSTTRSIETVGRRLPVLHAAIRSRLAERMAPGTANRMLAALRGTMKAAFRIGLISAEHRDP